MRLNKAALVLAVTIASLAPPSVATATTKPTNQYGMTFKENAAGSTLWNLPPTQKTVTDDDARRRMISAPAGRPYYAGQEDQASRLPGGHVPPADPWTDPDTKECISKLDQGNEIGFSLNRWVWCGYLKSYHYEISPQGARLGWFEMNTLAVGYGREDGKRTFDVRFVPQKVVYGGTYKPTTKVKVGMECKPDIRGCKAEGAEAWRTTVEWETSVGNWIPGHIESDAGAGIGDTKLGYPIYNFYTIFRDGSRKDAPQHWIRCDSATYFHARPAACIVWDVSPRLVYAIYDKDGKPTGQHGVAKHIKDALDKPDDTWPRKLDGAKKIPGRYKQPTDTEPFPGLQRIPVNSQSYRAHRYETSLACNRRPPYQDTGLPTPPTGDDQCDEYPFAATKQGSANIYWDFSVRAVNGKQNGSAGSVLSNYYLWDRQLHVQTMDGQPADFDGYWVDILDRQP
ncbi:hypothetical protein GCM10010124_08760 [Pilimelia terevasa]|uniref:Deoxyribonuclease NucA/NucB domain-containing protein n=1 Tax=Pilimelia terevasa TaxID=53372 RepID=A0A8J3BKZ4_9ACTN|nr:hypothetical protein [Pilimelia terevasa]GGK18425.1 hypothetical protein GCM10010124_08760 [Pilimelia terevasa]